MERVVQHNDSRSLTARVDALFTRLAAHVGMDDFTEMHAFKMVAV